MGKRGIGHRRTVLQLGDERRATPTFGFGYKPSSTQSSERLSGLMSNYVDSDDDSGDPSESNGASEELTSSDQLKKHVDHLSGQKFVAASDKFMPSSSSDHSAVVSSNGTAKHKEADVSSTTAKEPVDEVDAKVQDFLAEIGAMDEGSAEECPPTPPELPTSASEEPPEKDLDDQSPPEPPTEPTTEWQHCLDDGTQCYYYWNITTNAVTWEIPAEYSQYLLQYKEYEEKLAKYEKEKEEWSERQASRPPQSKPKEDSVVKTSKPAVEVSSSSLSLVSSYGNDTLADSDEEETEAEPLAETQEPPVPYEETTSEAEPEAQPAEPSVPEPEPSQDTCDSTDNGWHMDIDDIDAELDLALARKTLESNEAKGAEASEEATSGSEEPSELNGEINKTSPKRSVDDAEVDVESEEPSSKRPRFENDDEKTVVVEAAKEQTCPNVPDSSGEVSSKSSDNQEDLRAVEYLKDLVLSKLEFLDVCSSGLSHLQTLYLQIQTRLEDFNAGELSCDYFLQRLSSAHSELEAYEGSAVPEGWTCHWDSDYHRYFYRHTASGASQWDYPEPGKMAQYPRQTDPADKVTECPSESKQSAENSQLSELYGSAAASAVADDIISTILAAPPPPPPPPLDPDPSGQTLPDTSGMSSNEPPPPGMESEPSTNGISLVASYTYSDEEDNNESDPEPCEKFPAADSASTNEDTSPVNDSAHIVGAPMPSCTSSSDLGHSASPSPVPVSSTSSLASPSSSSSLGSTGEKSASKERRKKKSVLSNAGLALKKKGVSSLVHKWQQVQKEVEEEVLKEENS